MNFRLRKSAGYLWAKLLKKSRGSACKGSEVHKSSKIESGSNVRNSTMDRHSFCGYDCEIFNTDIGAFCSIGNRVVIGPGRHPIDWISTSPVFYEGRDSVRAKFATHSRPELPRTQILNDVWIGHGAYISAGVVIGNGAVIGMNAVVTKDVDDYAIVAGVPSKLLRFRFTPTTRERLLASRWWELGDREIIAIAHLAKDPDAFLAAIEQCCRER
jgi:acetyltransferase-like isoleucine patch superfamily enzyme